MAYPPPVPSLSKEEFEDFLEKLESFTISDEQRENIEKHRQAIQDNND